MNKKKPLTVLQIIPALDSGGVEKGTIEVSKALVDSGHKALVISSGGRLVGELEKTGATHVNWDLGKKSLTTFLQYRKLRQWLVENKVDALHARSRMPAWVAWLAWRGMPKLNRPRFITTVHGLNSVSAYSKIMTYGETVVAVSNTVKEYITVNYKGVKQDKIVVIPRGIDPVEFPFAYQPTEPWKFAWFEDFPNTKDKFIVTLPGRLTRLKGHHDLIRVIDGLREQIPEIHAVIVGSEDPKRMSYAEGLYKEVKDRGLDEFITFTGYRSDMKDIYAISDMVLSLSSKPESFGRTVVEAVSLGRAVVGYDHGGVGETLSQLYPVGLVPLDDLAAVRERIVALHDGSLLPPQSAITQYSKKDMLDGELSVYVD